MVLRGAQIHRRGQVKCSLVSARSLPHDLTRFSVRVLPLTSTDRDEVSDSSLDEVEPGPRLMAGNRFPRLAYDL